MERGDNTLRITRRWFSAVGVFQLLFMSVWLGLLIFASVMEYRSERELPGPLIPVLLLFYGVGFAGFYSALTQVFNRTTIWSSERELAVSHGPLPWRGDCLLAAGDIAQLYCTVVPIRRGARYAINVERRDGGLTRLVDGLPEAAHALFIEQELEAQLGIADRAVAGEIK